MKAVIWTLGCKVNKYESDSLARTLTDRGVEVSSKLEEADFYIINTCAVTSEAEKKSRQAVARCKKFNPNAKVFVVGCASEKNSKQFVEKGVTFVRGTERKQKILEFLESNGEEVENLSTEYCEMDFALPSRIRSYIKIQDGCNNFCSYCIIPYLRGRSRSRDFDKIVEEASALGGNVQEIVLTGINVADFKVNGEKALLPLLQKLDTLGKRLRLSSMEDCLVTEEFVKGLSNLKNFCPHFHLSLQSGCDETLKRMNRHYLADEFAKSVQLIRKYFPLAGITTDVIVGFCDESEDEFSKTLKFVEEVEFSELHIFSYSPREGTVACKLYRDLPSDVKKERSKQLERHACDLKDKFICKNIGKEEEILFEEKEEGYFVGYSKNYIKCYAQSEKDLANSILKVKILEPFKDGAKCEIIFEK